MVSRYPSAVRNALPVLVCGSFCLVWLVISTSAGQTLSSVQILPRALSSQIRIHVQAQGIPFNEWLSQLTLCVAPLTAHLLTGIPRAVVVHKPGPPWWASINLFNPITIIWRYIIIADRRFRSRKWTPSDMAASNSAFWIDGRWDGSEEVMVRSRPWLIRSPHRNRVSLISVSVIGTLIITVQGVQAAYEIGQQLKTQIVLIQAIAGMFMPLAIGSLFRLPCAFWLSDEFAYWAPPSGPDDIILGYPRQSSQGYAEITADEERGNIVHPLSIGRHESKISNLRSQRYWGTFVFRILILLALIGVVFGFGLGHLLAPGKFTEHFSASKLSIHFTYLSFTGLFFILCIWYFTRGEATTTLIPCINSMWYTIFTVMWYWMVLVAFVINAIEMRRTFCGVYTTSIPEDNMDTPMCSLIDQIP